MTIALAYLVIYGSFSLMVVGFTYPELFVNGARGLANLVHKGKAYLSKHVSGEKLLSKVAHDDEKSLSGELTGMKKA